MKQCPVCNKPFSRMKKGGCPMCGEPLFYSKKKARRVSDKILAIKVRELVKPTIEKNLGVGGYLMVEREWVIAYLIIDMLRAWLNTQPNKLVTLEELIDLVVRHFLADAYWRKNILSLGAIHKQGVSVAITIYRDLKIKKAAEETQQQRIANANLNQLNVEYS